MSTAASSDIFGQTPAAQHATRRLVEFALSVESRDLPDAVRHEATRSLVNFVGCAVGGSNHESVECAQRALAAISGPAAASIIRRTQITDVLPAALLNCT